MWCLCCFKPSTKHDPSKDRFELETDIVTEISLHEDVIRRQRRSEHEQLNWAIQESFNPPESSRRPHREDEGERRLTRENDEQVACALQYVEETELDQPVVNEEDAQISMIVEESLKEKGKREQLEDDEQLSLSVQESLYMVEPPPPLQENKNIATRAPLVKDEQRVSWESYKGKGQIKQSKDEVEEEGKLPMAGLNLNPLHRTCDGCNSAIEYGRYNYLLGANWHPECFCCLYCHKPIATHEFSPSKGKFHRTCYKKHRHRTCYICKKMIPSTAEGVKYNEHPFWKEKYCPFHEVDGTAKCCSCERLEPWGTKYVLLADNRWLCLKCMECAVMDTDEVQPLHFEIREFFESLNMKIEKEFHLFLVEKDALNKAEAEEKIDNQHGMVTRGICLSEAQMIDIVIERPVLGPDGKLIGMVIKS